ncbi:MAG: UDP-2,4-diacetamido-2,4,6-trideoxy-beta-L-altropyranose hydrolase [Caulobacter sp.]|nr:UDP-2,4-diacetamido-2,4,6-trideoxy-beta-L-altropyranose hydrolase [Caulobacter sp.]
MTARPRILFVPDAGPAVGGGHVMRDLTLARALEARGAVCVFRATPAAAAILDAFAPAAARTPDETTDRAGDDFDAVVIDHYGLAAPEHRAIANGRPTMVVDDLANRPLAADLVLDSGPARRAADYAGLVPDGAELMLGAAFAPVRPAFTALREAALARRAAQAPVRRALVSLGLTDVGAITGRVVQALLPHLGDVALDVVAGSGAPSLPLLRELAARDTRVALHVDAQDMPRLTLEADLAVGAGGSTAWERCVLGLPTLQVVLADNQRPATDALAKAGAIIPLDAASPGFEAELAAAFVQLAGDERRRARLAEAAAAACDGHGAERAAERFLALIAARAAG